MTTFEQEFKVMAFGSVYKYSPIHLSHYDGHVFGWSLEVQQQPEPKVVRKGRMPTKDEVVRALSATAFPAVMVEIVMVLAAIAQKETA
jgi:hypothetical protein